MSATYRRQVPSLSGTSPTSPKPRKNKHDAGVFQENNFAPVPEITHISGLYLVGSASRLSILPRGSKLLIYLHVHLHHFIFCFLA